MFLLRQSHIYHAYTDQMHTKRRSRIDLNEASAEFGFLLWEILELLKKNESRNLSVIKIVCSNLTIKDDSSTLLFTDEQLKAIEIYTDMDSLFRQQFRYYWRWDDCRFLTTIVSKLKEGSACKKMIQMYKTKVCSDIKLCHIYEQCKQEGCGVPDGYSKMTAIIKDRNFSDITLKQYDDLKQFISEHCGVESYVICPFCKAGSHSLILEWYIPLTAVTEMVDTATKNIDVFITKGFVYLKIFQTRIFDKRNNVRT